MLVLPVELFLVSRRVVVGPQGLSTAVPEVWARMEVETMVGLEVEVVGVRTLVQAELVGLGELPLAREAVAVAELLLEEQGATVKTAR